MTKTVKIICPLENRPRRIKWEDFWDTYSHSLDKIDPKILDLIFQKVLTETETAIKTNNCSGISELSFGFFKHIYRIFDYTEVTVDYIRKLNAKDLVDWLTRSYSIYDSVTLLCHWKSGNLFPDCWHDFTNSIKNRIAYRIQFIELIEKIYGEKFAFYRIRGIYDRNFDKTGCRSKNDVPIKTYYPIKSQWNKVKGRYIGLATRDIISLIRINGLKLNSIKKIDSEDLILEWKYLKELESKLC